MKLSPCSLALAIGLWLACLQPIVLASQNWAPLTDRAVFVDVSPTDTFVYEQDGVNFTFTFTANINGDIWFSMAAPNKFSWIAVGTGEEMDGSLMFIAYGDGTPTGVTLSGRFGNGHVEPTYSDMIDLSMVTPPSGPANMIEDGMLFVSGTSMNCTNLAMSTIDLTSTAQSFIFAVGEENRFPATMSKSGPLRRHAYYGTFTMDLTMATDMGGDDPISLHDMNENAMLTSFMKDHDIADPVHAFVLVLAFLVVFPSGVLSFRILKNVKLHMILQSIGLGLGVIGAASGFYLTTVYNRSKHFNSAHQIIGLLLVIALIGQWVAGFVNHRYYLRNRQPLMNGLPMKIHKRVMGPIILLVGLANGAIGFNFALANKWNYVYIPLSAAMLVVVAVVFFTRDIINRRIARTKRNPSIGAQAWYGEDHMTNRNMHGLNRIPSNPSMYDLNPVKPRDMT